MSARRLRLGPLLIPVVVAGLIPAALRLLLPGATWPLPVEVRLAAGTPIASLGLWLLADSVDRVYLRQATPLGDKPPEYLVREGWYRRVRNPMALGMLAALTGESLFIDSSALLGWALVVLLVARHAAVKIEEPSLARAFPHEYEAYRLRTPRWIPTLIRPGTHAASARSVRRP
ncbi:methyltransferase family protein [Streptomyces sp. NPDC019443]|uniref:methyltransferase family protein n=1 Tax=Streptomyces sp. NPDC019443 TaxID=3365061 RepID=UPI00378E424E